MYTTIKIIHISCAFISITGFTLRGLLKLFAPQLLELRWLKVAPHVIDTLLLVSATALAVMSNQYPFIQSWLSAKVIALLLYITLGVITLRFATTRSGQVTAFLLALGCAAYIIGAAINRTPLSWLNFLT